MISTKEDTVLLIIDLQDRLIPTIYAVEKILINIEALIRTVRIYQIPILLTEQEKLGTTVPEIKDVLRNFDSYEPIRKLDFSCYRNEEFRRILEQSGCSNLVICGIETHICVIQTALNLMEDGYRVQIPRDATSSHTKEDFETAIERLRDSGAVITTTEALIYELTEKAGTREFKRILEIIKDRRYRLKLGEIETT